MNDNNYDVRCAECGASGQMAVADAGGAFDSRACLAHWPHGALPKRAWLDLVIIPERARLAAAEQQPAAHAADDEEGDDDDL